MRKSLLFLLTLLTGALHAQDAPRTRNVVLIVTDGLRWQEVFSGAERALISARAGGARDTSRLLREFWREDVIDRRTTLLPFLWGTVAREGQLFGNQQKGSTAQITNTKRFSYPGYNEIFTGIFDPRIDSNDYPPNPNETVFEWFAKKPEFAGRVAAVATWGAFRRILNRDRAPITILDGWDPPFARLSQRSEREVTIDELYASSIRLWDDNAFDAPMHLATKEVIRRIRPRLLFVGYGETDEWAHAGRYDMVLQSAHRVDGFIADLWHAMQGMPEYQGSTTFIITTDHGRGSGPEEWKNHGEEVTGAENIWMAVIGPDTPALGERSGIARVTQNQIAATIAALLGADWNAPYPRAGLPIPVVTRRR